MDRIDIHKDQTVVKTIILGSRILAQGIYKGETAAGTVQTKIGQNYMRGNPFHSAKKWCLTKAPFSTTLRLS